MAIATLALLRGRQVPSEPGPHGPAGPAGDSDVSTKRLLQVSNPLLPQKGYRSHMSIRVSFHKKFYFRFCCLRSESTCPGQYIYVLGTKLKNLKICR